ncbi:MAG: glycosyltransferase family 4 protein [bacterium]
MDKAIPDAGQGRSISLLWLIDSLNMGGAENLLISFARALKEQSIKFSACCLKSIGGNPLESEIQAMDVPFLNLQSVNLRDYRAFLRLIRFIKDRKIDVIHAHLTYAGIWGTLAGRLTNTPCLTTLHVVPPEGKPWRRQVIRNRLLCKLLNRWGDGIITVSGALRHLYINSCDLDPGKIFIVPNGIDGTAFSQKTGNERLSLRREFGFPPEARIIVTVCVLRKAKGLDHLLSAAPAIIEADPGIRFLIVGDGPYREEMVQRSIREGLDSHIFWAGFRRDVPQILGASDLFVLPSLEDAFPTVLLEAMASGLPVVATNVGGIPEIVEHGRTGLLVPAGQPLLLAREILALLGEPDRLMTFGLQARKRVLTHFSEALWTERLIRLYKQIAEQDGKS